MPLFFFNYYYLNEHEFNIFLLIIGHSYYISVRVTILQTFIIMLGKKTIACIVMPKQQIKDINL